MADIPDINKKSGRLRFPEEIERAIEVLVKYAKQGTEQDDMIDRMADLVTRIMREVR